MTDRVLQRIHINRIYNREATINVMSDYRTYTRKRGRERSDLFLCWYYYKNVMLPDDRTVNDIE